jgi:hypothetical protein
MAYDQDIYPRAYPQLYMKGSYGAQGNRNHRETRDTSGG